MKLTIGQFIEAAFIFEKANGAIHTDFEREVIEKSNLKDLDVVELERLIVEGLNLGIYESEYERVSGYWALYKKGCEHLIPAFQKWLKLELELNQTIAIFQLLIALDNLSEPAFSKFTSS